ncbi:sugar transferase [Patescibacteria group bacterium]|nr:sugar transferase [Patescibacteria group bacterium]MBU1256244.1 sugar transferase [Patescibacteria group bacterium]MBU1457702.1 sugar transferase [Patescibacteria group bacterium]
MIFYEPIKRLIDITASLVLAVLFLPIWIIIPLLMKLEEPSAPIIYAPKRIGKYGRTFGLLKFRSMRMFKDKNGKPGHAFNFWRDNPKLFEKYKKAGWKLPLDKDPRITKIGRFIRQTSIDEMPQVFNILKGDMSLVGPRAYIQTEAEPEMTDAVKRYGKGIKKYIDLSQSVKPGLTGLWQVSGRNDVDWDERVKMDAAYAKRQSILEDIAIIIKTPFAMISKW